MSSRHVVSKFDQINFEEHPPPSTLVPRITSFATIQIVKFDPKNVKSWDIVVGITLSTFYIKATIWFADISRKLELRPAQLIEC